MKTFSRIALTLAVALILTIGCVALASAEGVYGSYNYTQTEVGFADLVKGAATDVYEFNKLVLFNAGTRTDRNVNNAYSWQEGDNYELIKTLTISDTGLHIWQVYYGSFEQNDNGTVTLQTPVYYSYYVFFGDCAAHEERGAQFHDQFGFNLFTADNEYFVTNGESGARDGLYDFNSPIADYHHSAGGEAAFDVKLDAANGTYEYYDADDDE